VHARERLDLERAEPRLELVEPPLEAHHVGFAQHRRFDGILGVLDEGRDGKRRSMSRCDVP